MVFADGDRFRRSFRGADCDQKSARLAVPKFTGDPQNHDFLHAEKQQLAFVHWIGSQREHASKP